mgnify:CR=1 FL=1
MDETTRGQATLQHVRFGLGGAVLGQLSLRRDTLGPLQTSASFVNCTFIDNMAYEGGAIAMNGVNTTITNCTFSNNNAIQNGFDVFASRGGTLDIRDSNIMVASPSVLWERVNPAQCMRGEFHGRMEGICRKCPGSTYSLATPVPAVCSPCPPNAKVGAR